MGSAVPVRLKGAAALVAALVVAPLLSGCFGHGIVVGDTDPHPAVWRARTMQIQGIDISRYQGRVDFAAAAAAGTKFVFIKATEGADYVDPNFSANWAAARAAGMPRGAYHFMAWCSLARDQAEWFKKNVPADPDALPPVLDLEWNHQSNCKVSHSRADILEKVRLMLREMEAHTGKMPIVYTDMSFHNEILAGEPFDNAFWLRSVAAEPERRFDNRMWSFWQWTQTGTMPGVEGEVDRTAYYGDEGEWVRFLLTGCDPRTADRVAITGRCGGLK